MGQLTTHVLDLAAGRPAAALRVQVHALSPGGPARLLNTAYTDQSGRPPAPLVDEAVFGKGRYSLTYSIGEYFRRTGVQLPDPPFLDEAVVHIGIARADERYHVPLLITPWSYSVYRGG